MDNTVSYLKRKEPEHVTYAVLLHNGEVVPIECHSYEDVASDEGDTIAYRFFKNKRCVAELEGSAVRAIISTEVLNYEDIIKALKKPKIKPRKKKAVQA